MPWRFVLVLVAGAALSGSAEAVETTPALPAAPMPISEAAPGSCPAPPPSMALILTAMQSADTFGHPDLFGEYAGIARYYKCQFPAAMKYFKIGSWYADKLSQLTIGVMYLNGQGVKRDAATACAWMNLAAQRQYPAYVAERNRVCAALTPPQRQRAQALYRRLLPEYGDKVAMQRMATTLRVTLRTELTGSRVAFDSGPANALGMLGQPGAFSFTGFSGLPSHCNALAVTYGGIPVPVEGCGLEWMWSPWYWNPKAYFAVRDGAYGDVSIGNPAEITRKRP